MLDIDGFVKILKEKGIKYKLRGNKYWRRIEIFNNKMKIVSVMVHGRDSSFRVDFPYKVTVESYLTRYFDVCTQPLRVEFVDEIRLELPDGYILVAENASAYYERPSIRIL